MQKQGIRPWLRAQMAKGRLYVTREELQKAFPLYSKAALSQAIARAEDDALLAYGWRGFYLLLPPAYAARKSLPPSLYIDGLMRYLNRPYCVSLLNAAETYGAAHQRPMRYTVMTSNPPPRSRKTGVVQIDFVAKREFNSGIPKELVRSIKVQTGYLSVSTPEVTALSLIQYAKAAGGLSHVVTVLEELVDECHFDKLSPLVLQYFPISCFQRLGYILEEVLQYADQANNLYAYLLEYHRRRLMPVLLSAGKADVSATFNKKWNVNINAQLESDLYDT